MNKIFDVFNLQERSRKPRQKGLTMVLDKYMGLAASRDLVETAGHFIDVIKLGWGSASLYPESVLKEKIDLFRKNDIFVCPGGTLLEFSFSRSEFKDLMLVLDDLGFNALEISDGIHPALTRRDKLNMMAEAREFGFHVYSEVGKKLLQEDIQMTSQRRIQDIKEDLAAGANKVILEARESGSVGIFYSDGQIRTDLACDLFQQIDPIQIIWEAPLKNQQLWLLQQLGSDVNIGNISPVDVLSLESMRYGLRADTLRDHLQEVKVFLEMGISGAFKAKQRGDLIIVVDALRASSTIIQCLEAGAESVTPVVSADQLMGGDKTIGERGGSKLPNADLGNSPIEVRNADLQGLSVVFTSTNGAECIQTAKSFENFVLIGSVNNCKAVAQAALRLSRQYNLNISIVTAGRNNRPAIEDTASATMIMQALDISANKGCLEPYFSMNLEKDFLASDSGQNLCSLGYYDDVVFCSRLNISSVVPLFDGNKIIKATI